MATNIFGNTTPAISPFTSAKKPVSPLGIGQGNFQTISGQNMQGTTVTPGLLSQLSSMGQKAKAPDQNVSKPVNTLPDSQKQTYTPPAAPTNQSTGGNAVIPQAPAGTPDPVVNAPQNNVPSNPGVTSNTSMPFQAPQNGGLYGQLMAQLANTGAQGSQGYNQAVNNLAQFRRQVAGESANIAQQPIDLTFQQGRQQVLTQKAAVEDAALQNAVNQQQTQQGQQINALSTALGAAQPQLGQFGQGYYNPLDPTSGAAGAGGGALNPINNVQSIAQQVVNHQLSPSQAYSMGGSVANWQSLLNSTIQQMSPGFNVAQAEGAYAARQQNTTTAGTAPTNAYASAYGQNYPIALQLQGQLQNVEGLGGLLLTTAQGGQINPFAPALANNTIAQFKSQLSSPEQARFNSTLAAFQGAASQLLTSGSGQIPTDVSANIAAISNGSLSLGALKAMVDQAKQEGAIKLQTAQSLVNTPGSQIGAPQVGQTSGGNDYQTYLRAIGQ